jgi:hypothetical protein
MQKTPASISIDGYASVVRSGTMGVYSVLKLSAGFVNAAFAE